MKNILLLPVLILYFICNAQSNLSAPINLSFGQDSIDFIRHMKQKGSLSYTSKMEVTAPTSKAIWKPELTLYTREITFNNVVVGTRHGQVIGNFIKNRLYSVRINFNLDEYACSAIIDELIKKYGYFTQYNDNETGNNKSYAFIWKFDQALLSVICRSKSSYGDSPKQEMLYLDENFFTYGQRELYYELQEKMKDNTKINISDF